jgi:DNA-binding transcriptional MerR regulator
VTDRTVSVRLRLMVRDYTSGATEAERMTHRLRQSQAALGNQSKRTAADLTKSAKAMDDWSRRVAVGTAVVAGGAAAAGGSLKVLAPALVTAGAAAGALPGLLGGAAASMGTLKIATLGVGDALGEVYDADDPFERLSPSARALVNEMGRLKPQILGFQQQIQNAALGSAAGNFNRLATTTLPRLTAEAVILGRAWDRTFTALTDAATDATVLDGLSVASRSSARFMDELAIRTQALARSTAILMMSADPLVRLIGDRLVASIDRMNNAAQKARQTGSLDEFFRAGVETGGALMSIIGDILTVTGQVVSAVNRQNTSIRNTADAFAAYVASGRSARDVAGVVDTLTAAYEGLADVLGPLAGIARDALADPATRDALATMFDILAAGSQAVRVVFDLFQSLPDPIQSVVIAAVALGAVAAKTTASVTTLGLAAQGTAAKLTAMGGAAAVAGRSLGGLAVVAGRIFWVVAALQLAGVALEKFEPAAANVDRLTESVKRFVETGQLSGEITRVFGQNLDGLNKAAAAAASDGWLAKMGRGAESLVPAVKSLNEIFQGGSFTESAERMEQLDAAISTYARTTNDAAGVTRVWQQVLSASGLNAAELHELLPRTSEELTRLNTATHEGSNAIAELDRRTKLLAGGFREAVTAGRSVIDVFNELNGKAIATAEAEIRVEDTVDRLTEALQRNGKALNKRGTDFDVTNEKGRENKQLTIDLLRLSAQYAEGVYQETDSVEKADKAYDRYVGQLRKALAGKKLTAEQIDTLIAKYGQMPDYKEVPVTTPGLPESTGKVEKFHEAFKAVPPSKTVPFFATTSEAEAAVRVLQNRIDALKSKHIYVTGTVRWTSTGDLQVPGGRILKGNRWGGLHTPTAMADGGIQAGIYPASDPPLYMFAEPETGGEAFIPRNGDRRRNLAILGEAARWNNAAIVPMAGGGVMAATAATSGGLVTVGPPSTTPRQRGSRLDTIDAYIRARDAVVDLNKSLKENGRSFSLATAKGRENRASLVDAIRAAQAAAQAKYAETGSIKAANAAYDSHIKRLRATLKQQGVNAATIKKLLASMSQRPSYDVPTKAPIGSERNISAMEGRIAAEESLSRLADHFSLVKPTLDIKDEVGRENLTELFGFLKSAERAAQAVLEQTGNKKTATAVYEQYVSQLRQVLAQSGMPKSQIDSLLKTYGKIVLTPNRFGGVYGPGGNPLRMSQGGLYNSARTLYGFAEPQTGGELFLPRLGDRARGENLLRIGAGWYGGRYQPSGGRGDSNTTVNNTLNVTGGQQRLGLPELQTLMRQMDAKARVGRKG